MKKLIITEEERKNILGKHIENGHTVSENMMGVAFGPEMNGLKVKKEETNEGPLDALSNIGAGLKGVWRGEGYDYFKHLNSLKSMMQNLKKFDTNGQYSVNYRVASRADSVQDSFFVRGNEAMKQKMNGEYPWRKT